MGLLDAVGGAISAAADAVSDVAGDIGEAVGDIGADIGQGLADIGDTFESIGLDLGPIGDIVDGAMEVLSSGSLGGMLNTALDKLGMPDWIGDIGGGVLDFCTGNMVGAAANGLDALEDVAKACGGDEIAGFLKAGSQVTGMFTGGLGSTGIGEVDKFIGTAKQTLDTVDQAMDGVESLMAGDLVGAGEQLFDVFGGDMGALEEVVGGLGDEAKDLLGEVIPQGKTLVDMLGGALADGKLDINDLSRLPVGELLGSVVGEESIGQFEAMAGPVVDFLSQGQEALEQLDQGGILPGGALANTLFGGIIDIAADRLGVDHADIAKLEARAGFASQLFEMATQDPNALGILEDLLSQAPGLGEAFEKISEQHISLRA